MACSSSEGRPREIQETNTRHPKVFNARQRDFAKGCIPSYARLQCMCILPDAVVHMRSSLCPIDHTQQSCRMGVGKPWIRQIFYIVTLDIIVAIDQERNPEVMSKGQLQDPFSFLGGEIGGQEHIFMQRPRHHQSLTDHHA